MSCPDSIILGGRTKPKPTVAFLEAVARGELRELVRQTVKDILNALLEEETMIEMCSADVFIGRIEGISEIL